MVFAKLASQSIRSAAYASSHPLALKILVAKANCLWDNRRFVELLIRTHIQNPRMQDSRKRLEVATTGGAIVGVVFGIAFFGIGLAVLFFMWSGDGGFHDPPIFFKIFASLIALPFVAVGATVAFGSFKALTGGASGGSPVAHLKDSASDDFHSGKASKAAYTCPRCAAPLADNADVSPQGDAKCGHCGGWFNIHKG